MLNRRVFLASALATCAIGMSPELAWAATPYVLPRKYLPRRVRLRTRFEPGEIHVDPNTFRLYWTLPGGRAIQYSVGVGRKGLYEPGTFYIGAKKEWPAWTPTRGMIARQPELYARWAGGMPGGPNNPLGARALYLFTPQRGDTFLRIHGTGKPETIGQAVSNGCTRLVNDHVTELYRHVPLGTRVVLHPKSMRGRIY
jgi:lipoprotein-anchoring transpeptidase ErfK/SrfK